MDRTIIHVDMDAFYAAVESRDNPDLAGRPLIIGGLPDEPRGVVSTCSYEARRFGVRSAMSIKEAYKRCPDAIYMRPDIAKYARISKELHEIWCTYTDLVEYVSLDEGYLDVTGSAYSFGSARDIARLIKERTGREVGLTCSVGVGYSMSSAKLASEERKPDGYFEIPNPEFFRNLIIDRDVRVIFGIGSKSAERLREMGILTVRDLLNNRPRLVNMFGRRGEQIFDMAQGIDDRSVTPYYKAEAKSLGREQTFQQDVTDREYIKSLLLVFAKELSLRLRASGTFAQTVTLKITFGGMKSITRSKSGEPTNRAEDIYGRAALLLDAVERKPIRLVGVSVSGFTKEAYHQLSLDELGDVDKQRKRERLEEKLYGLQRKYGPEIIRTGTELEAEKRLSSEPENDGDKDKK